MTFTIGLEYTPTAPQPGEPFTESSFTRRSVPFTFDIREVGVALVDLWNFGWPDGPVGETLGPEMSTERGRSHAERKRRIIQTKIAPAVDALRACGVQIFHCNHAQFLRKYSEQWLASTTEEERKALEPKPQPNAAPVSNSSSAAEGQEPLAKKWPPQDWQDGWRKQHSERIWGTSDWQSRQQKEVYAKAAIPKPVEPKGADLLVCSSAQFHRLLTQRQIRALFYMGFETDECVQFSPYGIANMQDNYQGHGYLCTIVRDCTATYELAETSEGQWKTKMAINSIEARWGYSVSSDSLLAAVDATRRAA